MTKAPIRREISVYLLRDLLSYDQYTGEFRWIARKPEHFEGRAKVRSPKNLANNFNSRFAGKVAGSLTSEGYLSVGIFGLSYLGHRLAFAIVKGYWPAEEIDHINGQTSDNTWKNLRPVPHIVNCKNQRRKGAKSSGVVGVDFHAKSQKWRARISDGGKVITIGSFQSLADAAAARKVAERKYGFHPNHGKIAA